MYESHPLEGNAHNAVPPAKPSAQWKDMQIARQRIGLMLVAHAKAQPQALLPHLAALANKTQDMWAAGSIGIGEASNLFDVMLAAAAGADLQLQKQVILHELCSQSILYSWCSAEQEEGCAQRSSWATVHQRHASCTIAIGCTE